MKYMADWRGLSIRRQAVTLIWSDGIVGWRSLDGRRFNSRVTSAWPISLFPTSNAGSRKYYLWKKMIGWKIDLFFITENFLGILDRLCAEPMCRSHDFLSLTLAVVGPTSGSCYFLLQCRCLWVCVLCFSCKVSEEWSGWIRRDLMYFTITTLIFIEKDLTIQNSFWSQIFNY